MAEMTSKVVYTSVVLAVAGCPAEKRHGPDTTVDGTSGDGPRADGPASQQGDPPLRPVLY